VFGGYLLSASMMIGAAAVGIAAERKPLELIAARIGGGEVTPWRDPR
jgi:hypothetical protein